VKIHCPRCGAALDVEPELDTVTFYDATELVVSLKSMGVRHTCPNPNRDANETPRIVGGKNGPQWV
jgi:hypothetical protein